MFFFHQMLVPLASALENRCENVEVSMPTLRLFARLRARKPAYVLSYTVVVPSPFKLTCTQDSSGKKIRRAVKTSYPPMTSLAFDLQGLSILFPFQVRPECFMLYNCPHAKEQGGKRVRQAWFASKGQSLAPNLPTFRCFVTLMRRFLLCICHPTP